MVTADVDERRPELPHRRGERGRERRRRRPAGGGAADRHAQRRDDAAVAGDARPIAPCSPARAASRGSPRAAATSCSRPGEIKQLVALREERAGALPLAAHGVGRSGAGRRRVRIPRREARAAADPSVQREPARAAQSSYLAQLDAALRGARRRHGAARRAPAGRARIPSRPLPRRRANRGDDADGRSPVAAAQRSSRRRCVAAPAGGLSARRLGTHRRRRGSRPSTSRTRCCSSAARSAPAR